MVRALSTGALAFLIAVFVSIPSQGAVERVTLWLAFPILLAIILLGVLFDMIGVAAAAAAEAPFNAMAAKRIPGARHALGLVQRADRVSSFANDIIGDIAASLAGAAGLAIALRIVGRFDSPEDATVTLAIGLVVALTVGGKAAMKGVAMSRADAIIFFVGRLLNWLEGMAYLRFIRRDFRRRPAGDIKKGRKAR